MTNITNITTIHPSKEQFDALVCECGCDLFFIASDFKAVCSSCRGWIKNDLILKGHCEHEPYMKMPTLNDGGIVQKCKKCGVIIDE